ncbi:TMAO reductase system periplasmic protein TorT [Vibrio sp. 10N]|uniref:TMAO reductase system periplasmic protein TorT n=1 Tax=Vibrio sp. 10N TaxID=3058938 RepID=UPI002813ACCB|nr:TMAO reductase system periplasmic protein TorT [Vibrio sp. 10N]
MPNKTHFFSTICALLIASGSQSAINQAQATPVKATSRAEKVCAIYPHLKDSYWLSVNYGMVTEAEKQHVTLKVLESGGYPNIDKQRAQLVACRQWGADAIILGTVSPTAFSDDLSQYTHDTPVFATVNHLIVDKTQRQHVKGVVGVDWYWMGYKVGEHLANQHPKGSGQVDVAFLPGPESSGGTKPVILGFLEAIKNSNVNVVNTRWADNDKELQRNLIQEIIETYPKLDYIVGSAVAIEAAISELRAQPEHSNIKLLSIYLSHGVYRGLLRNKVELAPTDKMVEQGQLSIRQATHYLRGESYQVDLAPNIEVLSPTSLDEQVIAESLSPSAFRPIFSVEEH